MALPRPFKKVQQVNKAKPDTFQSITMCSPQMRHAFDVSFAFQAQSTVLWLQKMALPDTLKHTCEQSSRRTKESRRICNSARHPPLSGLLKPDPNHHLATVL
eukprot:4024937-Amphidinium_carterae.1